MTTFGVGVFVGTFVGATVAVGVTVLVGVTVFVGVGDIVSVGIGSSVTSGSVTVGVGFSVGVTSSVGSGDTVGVVDGITEGVGITVGVNVGVGVIVTVRSGSVVTASVAVTVGVMLTVPILSSLRFSPPKIITRTPVIPASRIAAAAAHLHPFDFFLCSSIVFPFSWFEYTPLLDIMSRSSASSPLSQNETAAFGGLTLRRWACLLVIASEDYRTGTISSSRSSSSSISGPEPHICSS